MITQHTYTPEWLNSKVKEYEANSYDLAEKMAYAFTLLEQLKLKGLDFIFKGGTSLVLMLDKFHRFSKDIDIIVAEKPSKLKEIFNAIVADSPFIRWEESVRQKDDFQVPKEHYKFFYKQSKPSKFLELPILLDIIYVENPYPNTQQVDIFHPFLVTETPYTQIIIPTFDSITGDKLTAFAPTTIGIPVGKNKAVEIAKQLFDLNLLYDKIDSTQIVRQSFEQTSAMCIKYYKKDFTIPQIYQDIIDTAFVMAMMGKHNPELFNEIKKGVSALSNYINKKTNFGYDKALTAAAKIAYLVTCLRAGKEPEKFNWQLIKRNDFKNLKIEHSDYLVLNKALKAGYTEAWFYWLQIAEIISSQDKNKTNGSNAGEISKSPENKDYITFIVNGKMEVIENVNINHPLREAVNEALRLSGNIGRPITDWLVKFNNINLDISRRIVDFHFPIDAKIFISLRSGVGGK